MSAQTTSTAAAGETSGKGSLPLLGPLIALAISAGLLLWMSLGLQGADSGFQAGELAWPLSRILILVAVGLVVGQVIEATGWTRHLARLAEPLFRFAHLGPRCSAAFTTAFFSGVASNAMLVDFYREGRIGRKQLFLSNFLNHFPAFFLHLPTTLFIALPLAGWAGGIYMALVFIAIILRTGIFLLAGRLALPVPKEEEERESRARSRGQPPFREIVSGLRRKVPARFLRILQYVLPIYIFIHALNLMGAFDALRQVLSQNAISAVMPVESLSMVIIAFLADYTSGFATAGALLGNGVMGLHQAVIALLAGNIVAFPIRALRHQLPRYLGIYTPKLGTQILVLGQLARVLSLILVGTIYGLLTLPFAW